jgi:hypothetical protein
MKQGWCACTHSTALPDRLHREGGRLLILVYDFRFRQRLNQTFAQESACPRLATPLSGVRIAPPVLVGPGTNLPRVIRADSLWLAKARGQVRRFLLDFRALRARFEQIDLKFR